MKTIYKNKGLLLIGAVCLILISACTKEFKEFNTDPSKVTSQQALGDLQNIGAFFPDMEQNIVSDVDYIYQYQQSLNADAFSGYEMSPDPGFGACNYNYTMVPGWNQTTFDQGFQHIMQNWFQIKSKVGSQPQDQHFVAVALILKVEGMHRVSDVYGPLPYSKFGTASFFVPYDSQQAIYTQFFNELDTAENTLNTFIKAFPTSAPFEPFDLIYQGNYKEWLKFANTLRLRLAMRIAYVDPAMAKLQAEKAAAEPNGLLTAVTDDAYLNMVKGVTYQNSLWNITNAYGDISMGASMESIMDGYNDPREGSYFKASTAGAGTYKGIRIGSTINGAQYANFSLLNVVATTPMQIMLASESYFLRAEGALRGWNMGSGTAQSFYEAGVALSFQEKGVAMPAGYLTNTTSVAAPYVDPTNAANNSPGLNNITIAWDPTATFEQSLQRIITQKWIAIYPDGDEAWAEVRRTGYPKILNVLPADNTSGGIIKPGAFVERLPFAADEDQNNPKGVATGVTALGGPDNAATKLWWDTNPNGE
jgi:hypothetical protein